MMVSAAEIGKRVVITFEDNEEFEGWIYGELPQGILISLDQEGNNIRMIPKSWRSKNYPDTPRAAFSPPNSKEIKNKIYEINNGIQERFRHALRNINYYPFQRFAERALKIKKQIHDFEYSYNRFGGDQMFPMNEIVDFLGSRVDESTEIHAEVYGEIERSGIADIVSESWPQISRLPSKYVMPSIDYEMSNRGIVENLETIPDETWSRSRHRTLLNEARRSREKALIGFLSRPVLEEEMPHMEGPEPQRGFGIRYAGASLRIITGTGLAVANIGLGLTAGLASTLVTIGATAVPTYVGVATSIATGLVQTSEGLEKIGTLLNEQG
jgi:hypothetical protein